MTSALGENNHVRSTKVYQYRASKTRSKSAPSSSLNSWAGFVPNTKYSRSLRYLKTGRLKDATEFSMASVLETPRDMGRHIMTASIKTRISAFEMDL